MHDLDLVHRIDAGIHLMALHLDGEFVPLDVSEHIARHDVSRCIEDAHLPCDRLGGDRMIAGDHDHPNPGALRHGHRRSRLGSNRVAHAHDGHQYEIEFGGFQVIGLLIQGPVGDRQGPETPTGHVGGRLESVDPLFDIQRSRSLGCLDL